MLKSKSAILRKKEYMIWWHIKDRCYNPNNPRYKLYGGRGVIMCNEWFDFNVFFKDIEQLEGYNEEKILNGKIHLDKDSKDMNNKIYCKEKCRFISKEENNKYKPNQMKCFVAISPNGKKYIAFNQSEFAREHNLKQNCISDCLNDKAKQHKGWIIKYIK